MQMALGLMVYSVSSFCFFEGSNFLKHSVTYTHETNTGVSISPSPMYLWEPCKRRPFSAAWAAADHLLTLQIGLLSPGLHCKETVLLHGVTILIFLCKFTLCIFACLYVYHICTYMCIVYHMCAALCLVPVEVRREHQTPWNWS